MSHQISEEARSKAEVYYGDAVCQDKTKLLLKEVGLPNGLLPLRDIIECGYMEETGFVWLKQKKKVEHHFTSIGRLVSYAAEITAFVEKGRIKKVSGVKAKELLLWVPLYEISVDDPPTGKLTCKSTAGITKTFPTSAFEVPKAREENAGKKDTEDQIIKETEKEKEKEKETEKGTLPAEAAVNSKVAPVVEPQSSAKAESVAVTAATPTEQAVVVINK